MRTLYFDCFAGASGNMVLGALLALGVDRSRLIDELRKLAVAEFEVQIDDVDRSGISAVHVHVRAPHEHIHRHLNDIESIIDQSELAEKVKDRSKAIFRRLADAEARVHGIDVQKVHFHEVGAIDAIVDIVGACVGFEMLGVERFACSRVHVGSGFVTMEHGKYPVPPPAVAKLLEGVPAYSTDIVGELLTPTGAAIITTLCTEYGNIPEMTFESSGYGAGTREYEGFPNALRLILGDSRPAALSNGPESVLAEELCLLETNIDDMTAQVAGFVSEKALELGALDCWTTAVQMKKSRAGMVMSILCTPGERDRMMELLFTETTTLGVRSSVVERISLPRQIHSINTIYGSIEVKTAEYKGRIVSATPEYEQVKRAAQEYGVPLRQVQAEVIEAFKGAARSAAS